MKAAPRFRWLWRGLAIVLALYLAFVGTVFAAMMQPPERFGAFMRHAPMILVWGLTPAKRMWLYARRGTLSEGDQAPDFSLQTLDHKTRLTLSEHRGRRPVVLVFGSYTCPPFRQAVPALNTLYKNYADRVAFYIVYIQEAHPVDAWQLDDNVEDKVLFASTRTMEERSQVASVCMTRLAIKLPALIDDPSNTTERAYTGWPDRLYLINRDGRIAYKSAAGPFGFKPEPLEAAIKETLNVER